MIAIFKKFFILFAALVPALLLVFILQNDTKGGLPDMPSASDNGRPACGTAQVMQSILEKDLNYQNRLREIDQFVDEYAKKFKTSNDNVVITIPTVVHVVWNVNFPNQNISHSQIQSQIRILNEDFRRRNRDTNNTPVPFRTVASDAQIEFCLAKRDPNDNPSIGVTRTSTTVPEFGTDDLMKFNSTGGHDAWDRDKYLNLWVCNLGSSLLGYAYYPGAPPSIDGVVVHFRYFGNIGTAAPPYNLGRTATHEIGHWLSLRHIWGDDGGSCAGSDLCDDTPNQASEFYGCPVYPRLDACTPNAPGVMFMNYMDYTDDGCMNIFTMDQSNRMNGVMAGFRLPLQTSPGCSPVSGAPIAMFSSDSVSIEYGNTVHFSDASAGIPTSWQWSFPGGTPSSSNVQNPNIVYNTPGFYTVTLRVTNSHGSDSVTVVNYLRVRGAGMNAFNIVSPPSFTRIQVSQNDPTPEHFTWQRSSNNPTVNYKMRIRKLSSSTEYTYVSNNSGADTVKSFRRSFLDSLAATMGTAGDSVRCTWRVYSYNGLDSLVSTNSFLVTLVRNVIGIHKISTEIPDKFALYNNYPNPFNPFTKIKFDIPSGLTEKAVTKLTIYDVLGKEVAVLVNGSLSPGSYFADWDAANYPSGIYFYRLTTGQYSDTRKMVLVK